MKRTKRGIAGALLLVMTGGPIAEAVGSKKAAYIGGTVGKFSASDKEVEGRLDTSSETELVFTAERKPFGGVNFRIEYARVIDLEYGQKAGRRVGVAISTAILLTPLGLFSLFSKKRRHYLTIGYTDQNDQEQVAIIELGKDILRTSLAIIRTRSGKEIEYQDEEARKAGFGG